MKRYVITYQHKDADGRITASVAIIPGETPQKAEEVAANLHKSKGYELLGITTFKGQKFDASGLISHDRRKQLSTK